MPDGTHNPAAAGDDEIHVHHTHRVTSEQLKEYNKQLEGEGLSKSQREGFLRKYKEYDTELEDKTYEELVSIYKEVTKDAGYRPDISEEVFDLLEQKSARTALNQWEVIDTPEELRAEVRELMRMRDFDRVRKQEIETPPDSDEQAGADAGGGEIKHSYDFADAAADAAAAAAAAAAKAAAREAADEDAGDAEIEMPSESARRPTGADATPIEGDASSRLIGAGALSTEDFLRDESFSGKEEGEGAPDAAAARADAGDALYRKENYEEDILQEKTQNQNIDTQEQSTFEAASEQSVSSTEAQWSVDQDQLLNPYEDDPSPIPKDQLLNPYEDDPSSIPEDELLNPYEDDPSPIPEDELLNPYEDDPSPIPKDELLNPYEDDPVVDS